MIENEQDRAEFERWKQWHRANCTCGRKLYVRVIELPAETAAA
jgi:hypothetical protein